MKCLRRRSTPEQAQAGGGGAEQHRSIHFSDPERNAAFAYADNRIRTSKYNLITFLPKNLFEQFQRVANFYFLCFLVLLLIPYFSPFLPIIFILPLTTVLAFTAVKDAFDDFERHRSDRMVNSRVSFVLRGSHLVEEKWQNVKVGDIIRLESDHFVTADILLLSTSEPHGLCYIETSELDGETNLKCRQCLPETAQLGDNQERIGRIKAELVCEAPNEVLNRFRGALTWSNRTYAISNDQMLLRGCVLRNTQWCYGVVVFAGQDTKLMQNSGKTKNKRTSIDHLLSYIIVGIVLFLFLLCLTCSLARMIWESEYGRHFTHVIPWPAIANEWNRELFGDRMAIATVSGLVLFSYSLLLNGVVPISLYVSVEILRLAHSWWIDWDKQMVYKGCAARARSTTLNDELGQVEYVFSDKTGTLTQNMMLFKCCSIFGRVYGLPLDEFGNPCDSSDGCAPIDFAALNSLADTDDFAFYDRSLVDAIEQRDPETDVFFRVLALCHTVMPDERNGRLIYQAQSPDEGALVKAARNFGFVFCSRTPDSITCQFLGDEVTHDLITILDFNNVRKRMSVIVRDPISQQIVLYTKGTLAYPTCFLLFEL